MTQQSESQAMAHEATLFVMQMAGDSMINAGIHNGDLLIVDRSLAPVPGDVVAAVMDDEIAIKRLVSRAGITILHAENPRYPDYMPSNGASPAIWGHRHRCHSPVDIVIGPSHHGIRQYQHAHHLGAGLLKRLNALPHSGTCGDDIINEKHRVAIADEITLHPDMTGDTTGTLCRRDLLHGACLGGGAQGIAWSRIDAVPTQCPCHRFGQRCRMGTSSSAH